MSRDVRRGIVRFHITEKTLMLAQKENKITVIVDRTWTKHKIKEEVERMFGVRVVEVNTLITSRGEKKAYVKLAPEHNAYDLLVRLGLI